MAAVEGCENRPPIFQALYSFNGNSLSLVTSTLDMNQEAQLRLFLSRRLSKGTVFPNQGGISSMEFSLGKGADSPAVCYYILLDYNGGEETPKLILCLLTTATGLLDNFKEELGDFARKVLGSVDPVDPGQQPALEASLGNWYKSCIEYVPRVLTALGTQVASMLQLAVEGHATVDIACSDPDLKADLECFHSACCIPELTLSEPIQLRVTARDRKATLENTPVPSECCQQWGSTLLDAPKHDDPGQGKRVIEGFKAQVTSDLAHLKKLLDEAQTDHYACYRAYRFLLESGYGLTLLEQADQQWEVDSGVVEVLKENAALTNTAHDVL